MSNLFQSLIYSLLIAISISCQLPEPGTAANFLPKSKTFPVSKVVDGDTFWVDNGTEKGLKIRLIGIDAPETKRSFKKEIDYYGKEAQAYLTKLFTNKKVRLVSDVNPLDQYGRTLSYVYLEDGTFVNAELLKNGYAVLMTIPPNVAFADYFAKMQGEAREKKKGLWNEKARNNSQGFK
jgi:micrococcal nuclease